MVQFDEHIFQMGWNQLVYDHEHLYTWVVISNIFYFHQYLGMIPILTNIFQLGWNHQLVLNEVFLYQILQNKTGFFQVLMQLIWWYMFCFMF